MLFKKLHKQEETVDSQETVESEEDLEKLKAKLLRKLNFKERLKRWGIFLVIGVGLIGGFKSLFTTGDKATHEEIENQSFVTTYISNYYTFPKTEQTTEFLTNFTAKVDVANQFSDTLETARISDAEIYKVESDNETPNITSYYVSANYETKRKGQPASSSMLYCKVDVAKHESSYLVVKPVSNIAYQRTNIQDAEIVDTFKFEAETTNTKVDDEQKKEIENTITLFLKTYNEDVTQAKLLTTDASILNALDPNTKLELSIMQNCSMDDDNIYVTAKVNEKYQDIWTSTKNYYFVIDQVKQKIKTMEVY